MLWDKFKTLSVNIVKFVIFLDIFKEEKNKAEQEFNDIIEQKPIKDIFDDENVFDEKFENKFLKKHHDEKKLELRMFFKNLFVLDLEKSI